MITAQVCGLLLVILFLILTLRANRLGIYSERVYLILLISDIVTLFFDIASCFVIIYSAYLNTHFVDAICKIYVMCLVAMAWLACVYTLACLDNFKSSIIKQSYQLGVLIGILLAVGILPISFYYDGESLYSYGASTIVTYIAVASYIVMNIFFLVYYKEKIPVLRRQVMFIWIGVWTIAMIIQFLNSKLLVVGYATSFAMAILFFELENPSSRLDRQTGFFVFNTLAEYLTFLEMNNTNYKLAMIGVVDRRDGFLESDIISYIKFLESLLRGYSKKCKIFKYVGNSYIVVSTDVSFIDYIVEDLNNKSTFLQPTYVISDGNQDFDSIDTFISLFVNYADKTIKEKVRGSTTVLTSEDYNMLREFESTKSLIVNAIMDDRVEIFLQPIYNTIDKIFTSAEVLARIRDLDGSIIPPFKFIPVAEETGLILKLENVIFEQAVHYLKKEKLTDYGVHYLEINLSVKNGESPDLVSKYNKILLDNFVSPSAINLEITETASAESKLRLIDNMENLMSNGVRFSLDDFGSGESNLNYIIDMPVDIVKFDKDITDSYFKSEKACTVMTNAIRMIHELGLKVVVEGVETKEQLEEMISLGVEYIQGYYFSKPLPRDEFKSFIVQHNGRSSL